MITEIVTFEIPKAMKRERVIALFEETAEIWRAYKKLHRKNYLYDPESGIAGGVYTQTTDVEGEINGLITYDRKVVKIPAEELAELLKFK